LPDKDNNSVKLSSFWAETNANGKKLHPPKRFISVSKKISNKNSIEKINEIVNIITSRCLRET